MKKLIEEVKDMKNNYITNEKKIELNNNNEELEKTIKKLKEELNRKGIIINNMRNQIDRNNHKDNINKEKEEKKDKLNEEQFKLLKSENNRKEVIIRDLKINFENLKKENKILITEKDDLNEKNKAKKLDLQRKDEIIKDLKSKLFKFNNDKNKSHIIKETQILASTYEKQNNDYILSKSTKDNLNISKINNNTKKVNSTLKHILKDLLNIILKDKNNEELVKMNNFLEINNDNIDSEEIINLYENLKDKINEKEFMNKNNLNNYDSFSRSQNNNINIFNKNYNNYNKRDLIYETTDNTQGANNLYESRYDESDDLNQLFSRSKDNILNNNTNDFQRLKNKKVDLQSFQNSNNNN